MAYPSKAKWIVRPAASVALRYGLALVSVAAAQIVAHTFLYLHLPQPLTAFALCAIAITFRYGGTEPGIFAALFAALIRGYVFEPGVNTTARLCYDLVFLIFAMLMIRFTRERKELERRLAERTVELTRANEDLKLEIEDRKLVEEALRTSEREQRRIAEQLERERARFVEAQEVANIGSWELELQSLNVIWSDQTHRIFETDPSRFLPTRPKFLEFIHPEDRTKVDAAFKASLDNPSLCTVEYRIIMPDGSVKFLEERWQAFHDEQGKPVRIAGTCRDISERVRAEEELRQVRERIESILNSVSDTFILFDRQWRYLYLNDAAVRATGRPLKECLGRTLWELFPEVVGTELDCQFHRAMDERVHVEFDFLFLQHGFDMWWEIRTYPAPEGLAVFATEITERKRADEQLRRLSSELLRSQDEERRKIARDLHDSTGQDLVALATMLGQLRGLIPSAERKSRRLLSDCKALADQCIREIRTLSYVLHPPTLDRAGLADAIRDYVTGFTRRSGIQVELELSPRVGRMTRDTELALFRVVQESLTNIQRHSGSQDAKIRIHSNSHLTLEITDLGHGASAPEQRGREEPRFEVGVGIPSMQERVKLIGGQLDINSTSRGTTVRVTIPLEKNEREKAAHSGG
jgi:PAS domain S-box-containing protein